MASRGFVFELGDHVQDKVSGFEGIVTGRADHSLGCDTFAVQPRHIADGALPNPTWFDEPRLELVRRSR